MSPSSEWTASAAGNSLRTAGLQHPPQKVRHDDAPPRPAGPMRDVRDTVHPPRVPSPPRECCVRPTAPPPPTGVTAPEIACQYCGKPWPNRMSLAQHVRNRHMVESQQARNRETRGTTPTRQLWTEERRKTFLEVADRVGWSNHTLIASHLGMTIRQVRKLQNQVSPLALAGPHHADRHTPEPTDSPGRTSPPEQRDLVEAEPPGEANSTGQRNLEEADPPSDAETNPPGDVEMNPPGDAETDPPEQTDTPGQSDPAERGGLPGVDTPGQSDSAEQEDLTGGGSAHGGGPAR